MTIAEIKAHFLDVKSKLEKNEILFTDFIFDNKPVMNMVEIIIRKHEKKHQEQVAKGMSIVIEEELKSADEILTYIENDIKNQLEERERLNTHLAAIRKSDVVKENTGTQSPLDEKEKQEKIDIKSLEEQMSRFIWWLENYSHELSALEIAQCRAPITKVEEILSEDKTRMGKLQDKPAIAAMEAAMQPKWQKLKVLLADTEGYHSSYCALKHEGGEDLAELQKTCEQQIDQFSKLADAEIKSEAEAQVLAVSFVASMKQYMELIANVIKMLKLKSKCDEYMHGKDTFTIDDLGSISTLLQKQLNTFATTPDPTPAQGTFLPLLQSMSRLTLGISEMTRNNSEASSPTKTKNQN